LHGLSRNTRPDSAACYFNFRQFRHLHLDGFEKNPLIFLMTLRD
jgi:hypothetical protein